MISEVITKQSQQKSIRLSVVSHNQDDLVEQVLSSLARSCQTNRLLVTVTQNTLTSTIKRFSHFPFPVEIIQNAEPKGFGANHNQAFRTCREDYFCVLNPDIILCDDPFDPLVSSLSSPNIGVVAPAIVDFDDVLQDSARRFLTPVRVVARALFRGKQDFEFPTDTPLHPDWVAGMFMLFPASVFRETGGFDEQFFMYCEDADICKRLLNKGYRTMLLPQVQIIHDAQRASHNSFHHLRYHISSLLRFFIRYPFYTL